MTLHSVLTAKSEQVMLYWKDRVRGTLAPESMPAPELLNHLPEFLGQILDALAEADGLPSTDLPQELSATAAGHGEQRLRLGFSLDSVVREYGVLRDAIIETARVVGEPITFVELQIVFDCMIDGIAHAVSEYTRQRDAELLRQANEHFAFIAHELRNPLSAATLAFQQLQLKGQLAPESRAVRALERGLQRTTELLNQTLQIARVVSGIELRKEWTTLGSVFEEVEMGAAPEAESKEIQLQVVLEANERVHLDVRLVRSALGNLLRNAVKYTHAGGVVELRGSVDNGRVVIEVEDRCGGLETGKVEAAFAPFVRLDESQSGFGLGLAIAKQAVDAHGGSIRVQNLPGKGCIFVLELPVAQ